ncbi:MAG: mycofactocin biosynthesis peptidyl-dipeptidase MftE [Chloroflexaceae bacterium]
MDSLPPTWPDMAHLTWPEVARAVAGGADTVILPLGATEQHGPHLPLGTDTLRAEALARRLARRLPGALVAPALPIGCSDEHAGFPGLLSLDAATLATVIVDCARRMAAWGITRLVLLSAHGGNGQALALAVERLRRELPDLRVWLPAHTLAPDEAVLAVAAEAGITPEEFGLHAGEGETSELLWLRPDLVRAEAAAGYCGEMTTIVDTLQRLGLQAVTPNGVLGDPSRAHTARGERYLDARAGALAKELLA